MDKKIKFAVLVVGLAAVFAIFRWSPAAEWLTKENILGFLGIIRGEWWGPAVFILIYAVGCVVALPGSILTLAGGAVFGTAWGTVYNVVASNLGATLAFLAARTLGRDFVKGFLKGGRLAEFDEAIGRSGFKTIFRLRLIPVVPFNGLNFGAGFSAVRYRDYLTGSFLGMLPATFIYTYFADALLEGVTGAGQKAFLNLALAGALLVLVSFLPSIYKTIKERTNGKV
ncbi:MAG: TVP38/TMEM64 family protein [Candidatus Omnitrophica bacterium]|nr:TVP38/TMEM64 family protein [Candidatus Omnitrophota bacterium]